jgi:hypothetical protein
MRINYSLHDIDTEGRKLLMTLPATLWRGVVLALVFAGLLVALAPTPVSAASGCPLLLHATAQGNALLAPAFQVPNPLCGIFNLIRPWLGGAVLLGLIIGALGYMMRSIMPEASMQLQNGMKGVGIGLFITGIALQPAVLAGIAQALGATGLTFTC